MVTELRWSIEYINALEMPDVLEIYTYWKTNPPVHILLRVFSGYAVKKDRRTDLEKTVTHEYGSNILPFHNLPLEVQIAMLKDSKKYQVN